MHVNRQNVEKIIICDFLGKMWYNRLIRIEIFETVTIEKGAFTIFQIGSYVAHPGHGACTVKDIEKRAFGGETKEYYMLIPKTEPQTTILAPVDNAETIGIREIISCERANEIISYFSTVGTSWVNDHNKRRNAYEATLKDGNLDHIAKMIKELIVHESESTLNHSDKTMLPRAQKRLFSEIALAKGIGYENAIELVEAVI